MNLLVAEDEPRMLALLAKGLSAEGHNVSCAADGSEALQMLQHNRFDLVILDVMMPKVDGFEVAKRMRSENDRTPALMLTARDSISDVVHGLELGADDYITKPFSFHELLLRVRAVSRRACAKRIAHLKFGDLVIDLRTREVYRGSARISLTRTEYALLERLMREAGQVVPREALITALGRDIGGNNLEAFVRLLRNKIECNDRSKLIHTVRGIGYTIRTEDVQ
jgi:two-component system, OmpR family, response regulator MprA